MSGLKYTIFCFTFFSALTAVSDVPYVLCKNQKTVRTLRIDKTGEKCQTIYTKNGRDQVIGSGINYSSCQKFLDDVSANLTKAGWKCREPKDSAVSQLSENTQ